MSQDEVMGLLRCCAEDSVLFAVAQQAAARLAESGELRVILGEPQSCERLLRIYKRRLEWTQKRNTPVPGLNETVEALSRCGSLVQIGYAEADNGALIYFVRDEQGDLAGCAWKG